MNDEVVIPDNIEQLGRLPLIPKAIEIIKKEAPKLAELAIGCWQLGPLGNVDTYTMTCDPETPKETTVAHIKEIIDNGEE